jgi:hypothetical protein
VQNAYPAKEGIWLWQDALMGIPRYIKGRRLSAFEIGIKMQLKKKFQDTTAVTYVIHSQAKIGFNSSMYKG